MEQFNAIISGNTPVLVDFFATWCGPCKMMGPILQQLKTELGENIRIIKIDVDKNPAIAQHYQVRSVPTLKIFQNGQVKWSGSGVMQADQIASIVRKVTSQK
ncbi:thioredoxin [Mangrovibacterium diazotrophicum]|uniref:Thioredoxin n=1 Tax=Mangrovibacterium diazotrophicum TaxID=1261403 RepID=A0A419W8H7_9BACT|nr:thioredoxin [Mangrovibacterium diazotrophicum]RKD91759.1 thioredoxin [Mangrovibacterium diazotrophicum]